MVLWGEATVWRISLQQYKRSEINSLWRLPCSIKVLENNYTWNNKETVYKNLQ